MSLVKQPRRGNLLTQSPELDLEQRILSQLQEVTSRQDDLKGQVRDLRTILMGTGEGTETPYGRLPMVEAEIKRLSSEVTALKTAEIGARAYWNFARILGHVLTALGGGLVVALAESAIHYLVR